MKTNEELLKLVQNVHDGSRNAAMLGPVVEYFEYMVQKKAKLNALVTDGVETRKIVAIYDHTEVEDQFTEQPVFVTKTKYALSSVGDKVGSPCTITDCDPNKWTFV
jgi:hypothetical protein